MIMLGSTLYEGVKAVPEDFRWVPNLAVAFGKLVIQPAIATVTVCVLHSILPIGENNAASMYFAMLIVTCTPTANNINVMAEIGGVNKDTMALCILTQYMFAPLTITLWVTVFQYLVQNW
jgi:predicted permease